MKLNAFIGVAIEDKVVVRKLIATADESVHNLVKEATIELYNLIDKYIDEYVFKADAPEEEIEKYETAQIESEVAAEMRPIASLSKNGMIAAIAILVLAVIACVAVGFKFSDYLVSNDDDPEAEVLQQQVDTTPSTSQGGGELPPKTTVPVPSSTTENADNNSTSTTKKPNQITEFVSPLEPTSSIFDVEENQIPNTTRPQQKPTTTKPTTTKPTTTKEPEMPEETEEPTTLKPGFIVDSMG